MKLDELERESCIKWAIKAMEYYTTHKDAAQKGAARKTLKEIVKADEEFMKARSEVSPEQAELDKVLEELNNWSPS